MITSSVKFSYVLADGRHSLTPGALILVSVLLIGLGAVGTVAHLKGHAISRTAAGPMFAAMIGAFLLIVGVTWALNQP